MLLLEMEQGECVSAPLRTGGLLSQPCGVGRCGKCLILADTEPCLKEKEILGAAAIASGFRLACYTTAAQGLRITIPRPERLHVLTDFAADEYVFKPVVENRPVHVPVPSLDDQRTDLARLMQAASATSHALTLKRLARLPEILRSGDDVYALVQGDDILGFSLSGDHLALIVDIGTTTVAAFLVDLERRYSMSVRGEHNAQAPFGADVISRIQRSMEDGTEPLQQAMLTQINRLLESMLEETGHTDVSLLSITGNTTMLHLLCGLPPINIGRAPFTPVTSSAMRCNARELGINSDAPVYLPPGISAYIGPDITTAMLAAQAVRAEENFLLIDFGTNAETVLFADGTFYACSAAAGPCFEGATLSCGMAGQPGAVDTVFAAPEGAGYTVLGGGEPRGICGSGCIDAVALLLASGHVDETGRMMPDAEFPYAGSAAISGKGEEPTMTQACFAGIGREIREDCFFLTPSVFISQKDVREVQLAKAAVRAGIEVLLEEAGIIAEQVQRLYLAGGFGSAMSPAGAARLGLIPVELAGRVRVLGNAAGFGALRYVTEQGAIEEAEKLVSRVRYIELSAHSGFSAHYVEQMMFPGI